MAQFRYSGHESFPLRFPWLPKAYQQLSINNRLFDNEEEAMVLLGVGKNMVRAIKFWATTVGIAQNGINGQMRVTEFGKQLLGARGLDPFLEDLNTLWLIHWQICSSPEPLFAWDFLLNRWQHPELVRSEVLKAFAQEAEPTSERKLSAVTLEQHFDVFLHTYVPTRGPKGEVKEENLDSPLTDLRLVKMVGQRRSSQGRSEAIYAFNRDAKPQISQGLFIYCIADYWQRRHSTESTLSFRDISVGSGSPGQLFKMPEWELRDRLHSMSADTSGLFIYKETASLQQLVRSTRNKYTIPFAQIYSQEDSSAKA